MHDENGRRLSGGRVSWKSWGTKTPRCNRCVCERSRKLVCLRRKWVSAQTPPPPLPPTCCDSHHKSFYYFFPPAKRKEEEAEALNASGCFWSRTDRNIAACCCRPTASLHVSSVFCAKKISKIKSFFVTKLLPLLQMSHFLLLLMVTSWGRSSSGVNLMNWLELLTFWEVLFEQRERLA